MEHSSNDTDRFIPREGEMRILWLAGINTKKITAREYRRVHLETTCEELSSGVHQLNLSMYSVFLIGTMIVYERQCYYLYKDLDKLINRFKDTMNACSITLQETTPSKAMSKVTLPDQSFLILEAFNQLRLTGPSYSLLPDSEFFTIDGINPEDSYTVADIKDITLPHSRDSNSSLNYSMIDELDFDFTNALPTPNQPPITDNNNDNNSVDPMATDKAQQQPTPIKSSGSMPLAPFISPLKDDDDDIRPLPEEVILQEQVVKRGSVKRRLALDKATELSDKQLEMNSKSCKSTLIKCVNRECALRKDAQLLLSTPSDPTVYSHKDLLALWQMGVTPIASPIAADNNYKHQETNESMEWMRVGHSYNSSEGGINRMSGTEFSMNASNSLNRGVISLNESSKLNRANTLLGPRKGLSPIADIEEEHLISNNEEHLFVDNLLLTPPSLTSLNDSKSSCFFKSHMVSVMGEKEQVTFTELVHSSQSSGTSCRRAASLTMMHVLELINRGIVTPAQDKPYQEIFIKRGRNF